jgi:hypothetical protein
MREVRTIEVLLDPSAATLYDAALTGNDSDVLLQVEKAIVSTLYPDRVIAGGLGGPQVDLDVDLVEVQPTT